jgi:hypothetical protein
VILDVLLQPLAYTALDVLGRAGASGVWSYVAILANSAIWGIGLYSVWKLTTTHKKEARR